jgi:hypothetical protein
VERDPTDWAGSALTYPNMLDVAIDIERVPEIPDLLRRGFHVGVLRYSSNGRNWEAEWQELRGFSDLEGHVLSLSPPCRVWTERGF